MIERLMLVWRGLAARERRIVGVGAVVLLLALAYLLLFEPAWKGRERLTREIPTLRSQLAQMQGLAAEAKRLASEPRTADSPQAQRLALEQSVRAAGLATGLAQLKLEGELFELRFNSVLYSAWLEWLDTTLRGTRMRVVDASVTREAAPGVVSARLVLEAPRREGR